jgi:membrane protein DedA with SNARE-associated domain
MNALVWTYLSMALLIGCFITFRLTRWIYKRKIRKIYKKHNITAIS